ncbi:MAG: phosphatidylglycerol lysyltransferase domain-containing protein [Treponema sp.]|nr:phosphatidylglycerol lysyltransferase domain-containing protein [Treponema sp.]MCL2250436.1 phosphatidylglycerol lysyltransferase domain-containing protein [Treponema sp.]
MNVPFFPDFAPLEIELKNELHPRLSLTFDGVSEFTFSGLYLFRKKYNYRISRNGPDGGFIISGEQNEKSFFMTPCAAPNQETLESLFASHDYWKNISETVLKQNVIKKGILIEEDRDNFDYLYYRNELAELSGKKFHKKKNHVNNFLLAYPDNEQKPMNKETIPAAMEILERWRSDLINRNAASGINNEGDYKAAKEALDLFDSLTLKGSVFFISGKPVAYCLGESISRGKMFAIHFEKAVDEYRGIYQFINQAFAASLPRFFTLINREQDLGNEGLRQAKMTYRPCAFVQKYKGVKI